MRYFTSLSGSCWKQLLFVLCLALIASAQNAASMNNDDVFRMLQLGDSDDTLIAYINAHAASFNLEDPKLVGLIKDHTAVIDAMVASFKRQGQRTTAAVVPASIAAGVPTEHQAATATQKQEQIDNAVVISAASSLGPNALESSNILRSSSLESGTGSPTPEGQNTCSKGLTVPAVYAVQEGSAQISGSAAQPPNGCSAQLNVYSIKQASSVDPKDPSKTIVFVQKQLLALTSPSNPVPSGGKFSLQLQNPLEAGQRIQVEEIVTEDSTKKSDSLLSTVSEAASVGDWGRVRAYFTSGILVSQDQSSFSQSSLFLSFSLDKAWRLPGYYYGKRRGNSVVPRLAWPPGINSFFETRLTSIPVTAQTCQPGSGTGTAANPCPSGDQLTTFLSSRKTARLQVGAYLPFTLTGWTYKGNANALFLAPIAKVGFDTPTAPANPQQLQAQSTAVTGTASTQATLVNNTNFYNFYAYGARFGHYALTNSKDEAPELVSHLDIMAGKFSNLESVLSDGSRKRLYRLNLEGILKVPSTPLIVGLSANIGQSSAGVGPLAIKQKAGDDLRFLFGTKFDVGKLVGEIKKSAF